jgi:hypothetical protein
MQKRFTLKEIKLSFDIGDSGSKNCLWWDLAETAFDWSLVLGGMCFHSYWNSIEFGL